MAIYSLKMRASRHNGSIQEHVSGAEKILQAPELKEQTAALLERAMHHAKGRPDFINLKIEEIPPEGLQYIDALPVATMEVPSPEAGRQAMADGLADLGIPPEKAKKIMDMFRATYSMRGAMLLDADTLERLEPDQTRGIRATYMDADYMDAEHSASRSASHCKNHFQEAIVLASKVLSAPHIIAELCMSDDPDYITGYIATHAKGYTRITRLKPMGCPDGGRIFLYRGPREDVAACISYLQEQRVLVRNVPAAPPPAHPIHPIYPAVPASNHQQIPVAEKNRPDTDCTGALEPWQVYADILADKQRHCLYRNTTEIASPQSAHVTCHGRNMLMLASNDYLDLINHPAVKAAAQKAVNIYGTGSGGSRLTTGTLPLHNALEKELASFKGTEAALIFNTGYMANVGILSAMGVKGSIIFSDERNHASIIDGCRLSHAKTVIYPHNDMEALEARLREYTGCQGLIVTDAVFSMDGDIARLPQIMALAKKYHVLTMVDEAHSTGVIGKTGRGIAEYFNLTEKPDILMGTMSKALAAEGGYACGSQLLIDYLRNTARSYIFSTSAAPAVLAAASQALRLLREQPELTQRLQENTRIFCHALRENGIMADSKTAIVPIILHDEELAVKTAAALRQKNIYISAIRYPTVAKGRAMLRAALMSTHTAAELRQAAKTIAETIHECRHNLHLPKK